MIKECYRCLDDELVIIAEDRTGRAVRHACVLTGCLPGFSRRAVDNARTISIGVIGPLVDKGLGVLMGLHLARNLIAKGYRTLEASWIREDNIRRRTCLPAAFSAARAQFALFEKTL